MGSGFLYKSLCFVVPGNQINHLVQQNTVCRFCIHLGQHMAKGTVSVIPVWIIDLPHTAVLLGGFSGISNFLPLMKFSCLLQQALPDILCHTLTSRFFAPFLHFGILRGPFCTVNRLCQQRRKLIPICRFILLDRMRPDFEWRRGSRIQGKISHSSSGQFPYWQRSLITSMPGQVSFLPYRTPIAKHFILCHSAKLVPYLHQCKAQQVLSTPLRGVLGLRGAGR